MYNSFGLDANSIATGSHAYYSTATLNYDVHYEHRASSSYPHIPFYSVCVYLFLALQGIVLIGSSTAVLDSKTWMNNNSCIQSFYFLVISSLRKK
jgi:hypothetical protein